MTNSTSNSASTAAYNSDSVRVKLDRNPPAYAAGQELTATVTLPEDAEREVSAAELSIVWYTTGKGDEDLHVHVFERWAPKADPGDRELSTRLPMSPLSYAGVIVKVCWCVRVRLFLDGGRQVLVEEPFQLGGIRPAELASDEPSATAL